MVQPPSILALPCLAELGVHLWLIDLEGASGSWNDDWLSDEETARASRFRFEVHAHRYRASHGALRHILGEVTGRPPKALRFTAGREGKPRLDHDDAPHFNMSHSGGWALIGTCATHPIGVDVEVIKPMSDAAALVKSHFTASEQSCFQKTPQERQLAAFFSGWTRKEACLKAVGSGLTIEPRTFEAGLDPLPCHTTILVNGEPCAMQVRSLGDLPGSNLAAAVARLAEPHCPDHL